MKKIKLITAIILLLPLFMQAQLDRSVMPEPAPAPEIQIGDFDSFTLENGLKVFVVENTKLPVVSFSFVFDYDPILEGDKAGLSDITGQLLRTGTINRTKEEIDEAIDFIGARVSTSASSLFASSLSRHTNTLLDIISDIIINAKFNQEELDRLKTQTMSALAAEKNSPDAIMQRLRRQLVYGENHPYGESATEETVANIELSDCEALYKTYIRPNVSYLAIVGDVTMDEIKPKIKKYFAAWEKADVPTHTYNTPQLPAETTVSIVDRPAAVQSNISVAFPVELQQNSEDLLHARLMNNILGGGTARLFDNLRETYGFTYGAYSRLSADKLIGNFNAVTSVRTSATDSAFTQIFYEINRIREEPVPLNELNMRKNEMAGGFALSLERPQTIARFALNIERYNLPEDYYANYLRNIEAMGQKEVMAAAQKYLHPENAYVIAVGRAEDIVEGLRQFSPSGQVNFYDERGNWYDPALVLTPAPEGMTAEKVIDKYIEAIGGQRRVSRINDISQVYTATIQGMEIQMKSYQKAPDKMMMEVGGGGMIFSKQVFDGKRAIAESPMMGQKEELEGDDLESMRFQAIIMPELRYAELNVETELLGVEKIGDKEAYKVRVTLPTGSTSYDYFDVKTGLKIRSISEAGRADYSDYRTVSRIKFPHQISQDMEGQSLNLKLQSVEINSRLKDSLFEIK